MTFGILFSGGNHYCKDACVKQIGDDYNKIMLCILDACDIVIPTRKGIFLHTSYIVMENCILERTC